MGEMDVSTLKDLRIPLADGRRGGGGRGEGLARWVILLDVTHPNVFTNPIKNDR